MNIAYVLVQSTIGHEMEVLRDLLKFDIVKEAKGTFGYYDILVKIEAASEKEIGKILTKKEGLILKVMILLYILLVMISIS